VFTIHVPRAATTRHAKPVDRRNAVTNIENVSRRAGVNTCLVAMLAVDLGAAGPLVGCSSTPVHADAASGDAAGPDGVPDGAASDGGFRALFNGADFTGWDRYLGTPYEGGPPLGLNNDPRADYSVVTIDGEPAIRLSGEVFGSLTTQEEFCHFDLRVQHRWGTRSWPPLGCCDSGLMYMSTGPFGAVNAGGPPLSNPIGSGGFMVSVEYQIVTGDIGGVTTLGPITLHIGPHPLGTVRDAPLWNDLEIIVDGAGARHFLNGQQVGSASDFMIQWPGQATGPLSCGKLQLESEGAEVFYRHIEILPLP
jgi:hypothetical protein